MSTIPSPATSIPPLLPPPGAFPASKEDALFEVVNGQIVELPPMGAYETDIASLLVAFLGPFARTQQMGRVVGEMLFVLNRTLGLERRPDVAFVSYQRWPRRRRVPRLRSWDVVPELAVEVVSPTNTADGVSIKVKEYFQAGVQLVWVIYPSIEMVHVYEALDRIRVVKRDEELDGGALLPDFRLPLAILFEEESDGASTSPA